MATEECNGGQPEAQPLHPEADTSSGAARASLPRLCLGRRQRRAPGAAAPPPPPKPAIPRLPHKPPPAAQLAAAFGALAQLLAAEWRSIRGLNLGVFCYVSYPGLNFNWQLPWHLHLLPRRNTVLNHLQATGHRK